MRISYRQGELLRQIKGEMGEENKVILHGMFASPFSKRVEMALKLKGIPFEYVEEDLQNKSPQLLQYNPVYKKIPVLVRNGKPIAESLVILEYIDETWKNSPRLLPEDPYKRAKVASGPATCSHNCLKQCSKWLKLMEKHKRQPFKELLEKLQGARRGNRRILSKWQSLHYNENIGLLDIVIFSMVGAHEVQEEVLGLKILDPERTPLILSWLTAMNQVPLVKELIPPYDKLVAVLKFVKRECAQVFFSLVSFVVCLMLLGIVAASTSSCCLK